MPIQPPRIASCPGSGRQAAGRRSRHPAVLVLAAFLVIAPGLPNAVQATGPDVLAGTPTETASQTPVPSPAPARPSVSIDGASGDQVGRARVRTDTAASDADGRGSGTVARTIRLDQAPATATGCGVFGLIRAMSLGEGNYDDARITPGPPPTSGCVRASLELVDRVGLRSNTVGDPLRIQPAVSTPAKPAAPRWSGGLNLYRTTAFVTQKDFKWCVAASVQMMVNIVRHKGDRTTATQKRMINYAQASDNGPYGPEGGTDVTGWIAALRHFGAGKYRAVGASTPGKALRIAAIAIRQTGRPAGILVMDGRHAWVLHGFESKTDPRLDGRAKVTSVRVSGPLYPVQQKNGYDLPPNTELSVRALARYFLPSSVGALVGKYVVIVPTH